MCEQTLATCNVTNSATQRCWANTNWSDSAITMAFYWFNGSAIEGLTDQISECCYIKSSIHITCGVGFLALGGHKNRFQLCAYSYNYDSVYLDIRSKRF